MSESAQFASTTASATIGASPREQEKPAAVEPQANGEAIGASDQILSEESRAILAEFQRPASRVLKLDRESLRAGRLLPEVEQEQRLREEYRRIKRPILERLRTLVRSRVDGGHLIMVASALPGDGKSFTSLNLALSIAREKDFPVLLVDADVAKRHLTRAFQLEAREGLLDALDDPDKYIESFVIPTDNPRFSILPAGIPRDSAAEMLASVRTAAVVANLSFADPDRVVVIDSPPLLLSSEARELVKLVGQVVLVVRAGVTPQAAIRDALSNIAKDKLAGAIFNESRMFLEDGYYGYGYGYGEGE